MGILRVAILSFCVADAQTVRYKTLVSSNKIRLSLNWAHRKSYAPSLNFLCSSCLFYNLWYKTIRHLTALLDTGVYFYILFFIITDYHDSQLNTPAIPTFPFASFVRTELCAMFYLIKLCKAVCIAQFPV